MVLSGLDVYAHTSTSPSAKIQQLWSRRHFSVKGWNRCMRCLGEHREDSEPCMRSAAVQNQIPPLSQQDKCLAESSRTTCPLICGVTRWQQKNEMNKRASISTLQLWFLRIPPKKGGIQLGEVMGCCHLAKGLRSSDGVTCVRTKAQQQRLASAGHRRGKGTFYCS